MELTPTFMAMLEGFRPVFTSPSYATFSLLMTGWILSVRHRYVTDLIISSDSVGNGHFSDYHRFFSHAKWNIDDLWKHLAPLLIDQFVGPDAVIIVAGDDTLCRKRGLGLFGAGMHHDPLISSRAMKLVSWGHDWVNLCLIVADPWWAPGKVFALPICMRLYRNKQGVTKGKAKQGQGSKKKSAPSTKRRKKQAKRVQRKERKVAARQRKKVANRKKTSVSTHVTRPELMRQMLQLVASWFPDRQFLFVGDSLYTGESVLRYLPENFDLIGGVHPKGALYEPAPKKQSGRGGPRKKGQRLPTRDAWAASRDPWTPITFDQFGLHGTFETKTRTGLYYKAGKDRMLKFVLTRDTIGDRPTQIFYCTNLEMDVQQILSTYAHRWAIEVTHYDAKQLLGLEDPANRLPLAVQRTAPMAMFLYSLTILWYAQHGHAQVQFPERPWYTHKSQPSFADMLTTLRRVTWEDKISPVRPRSTVWQKSVDLLTYLATLAG
jgi:hypothetical protein